MIVHLIRHGRSVRDGDLLGRTDAELAADGLAASVRAITATSPRTLITSPLKRARASAEAVAAREGLHAQIRTEWAEINFGDWDGQPLATLQADPLARYPAFLMAPDATPIPGGEAWSAFLDRIGRALRDVVCHEPDAPIAIVTHAGAIRAAVHIACGLDFRSTWSLRIAHAATLTLNLGLHNDKLWGEIVSLKQAET